MKCPKCGGDLAQVGTFWICPDHGEVDTKSLANGSIPALESETQPRLFISYGRKDALELANRLAGHLDAQGFDVWLDTREITAGTNWQHEITDGLRSAQVVIALLSPHSIRTTNSIDSPDGIDSVCLGEISYALFTPPPRPVVPVMATQCEPPLAIFHLDYVDLTRWRDSESQYQSGIERLLEGIQDALKGKKRYRSWYHQLKPWDFAAFLHEKRRDFYGRSWLFDEIDKWRSTSTHERALLITGDPGSGKSAIVAELIQRNSGGQVIAYHCCMSDTRATLEPWRFVRSIAAMIASRIPEYAAALEDSLIQDELSEASCRSDPAAALERGILAPLECLPAPGDEVRYIVIDALDEALTLHDGLTIVQMLASRISRLPSWLRLLATTRKEPAVVNRMRGLKASELSSFDSRNREDVTNYIHSRLSAPLLASCISQSGSSLKSILDELAARSDGNFLYARQALDGLERGIYSLTELHTLPTGLYGLYDTYFRRQFGEEAESYPEAKRVLEVIVAAKEPLNADELSAATQLHRRRELPGVLNRLSSFVPGITDETGRTTYTVFHKSLAEWLTAEDLLGTLFSILPEDGHEQISQWGWEEYSRGDDHLSAYVLRHLPTHLRNAKRWEDFAELLTDLAYLEHRNATDELFELIGDLDAAETAPLHAPAQDILKLLSRAFRNDLYFMTRHALDYPSGLFQCLWNRCRSSDPAQSSTSTSAINDLLDQWVGAISVRAHSRDRFWLRLIRPVNAHISSSRGYSLAGHRGPVTCLSFQKNTSLLVSGGSDQTVRIWDLKSLRELDSGYIHHGTVTALIVTEDGKTIISAGTDHTLIGWDTSSNAEAWRLELEGEEVCSICQLDNLQIVALGTASGKIMLVNVKESCVTDHLQSHESAIVSLTYSPETNCLCSASEAGTVWVSVLDNFENRCEIHLNECVERAGFLSDAKRLCCLTKSGEVSLWNIENLQHPVLISSKALHARTICWIPGSETFLLAMPDRRIQEYDPLRECLIRDCAYLDKPVMQLTVSPSRNRAAASTWDGLIRIFDLDNLGVNSLRSFDSNPIERFAFSPDGNFYATAARGGIICINDLKSGNEIWNVKTPVEWVEDFGFSEDGRRVILQTDHQCLIWDAKKGDSIPFIAGVTDRIDASQINSNSNNYRIRTTLSETFLEAVDSAEAIAWYPVYLERLVKHPQKDIWAGLSNGELHLFKLETVP